MKKLNKIIGCVLVSMSFFSCPAFALIIEGTFSGNLGFISNYNMDVTPDAKFFREQDFNSENGYRPFTGTFWYDTGLVGPGISPWDPDIVMYIAERDWLHTTLVGANGASVEITSRGGLPSFSKNPTDSIYIERSDYGYTYEDRLSMFYNDFKGSTVPGVEGPHREGGILIGSNTPILDGFGLIQNFEFSSELNGNKPIGSVHLGTKGVLGGIAYEGSFWGQINKFEIHTKDSVAVPEPSSLLLFLGPIIFLFWRAGLVPARFRLLRAINS